MSEPKRMSDEQYDAHADGNVLMSDFAAVYHEGLRARAREKRLEERVARDRVLLQRAQALLNGARFDWDDPAPLLAAVALGDDLRAALSEET